MSQTIQTDVPAEIAAASAPQSTDPADHGAAPAPEQQANDEPALPPEAAVPEPPKGQQYPKWEMERIRVMARVNGDLKKQMAEAQERIRVMEAAIARQGAQPNPQDNTPQPPAGVPAAKPGTAVYSQEQVQAEAQRIAAEQLEQQQFHSTVKEFAAKGAGTYQDWGDKIQAFENIGGLDGHPEFVKAVLALPNGSDVLYTLGSNLDHANHVLNNLTGMQQAMALVQLSGSLAAANPPQGGQAASFAAPPVAPPNVSRAPAPTRAIGGRPSATGSGNIYDPKISMEEYAKLRSKPA